MWIEFQNLCLDIYKLFLRRLQKKLMLFSAKMFLLLIGVLILVLCFAMFLLAIFFAFAHLPILALAAVYTALITLAFALIPLLLGVFIKAK